MISVTTKRTAAGILIFMVRAPLEKTERLALTGLWLSGHDWLSRRKGCIPVSARQLAPFTRDAIAEREHLTPFRA